MEQGYHRSVLCNELLTYLKPQPHEIYVDATFGGGGHTRLILRAEPTCRVIGFDWDERALALNAAAVSEEFPDRFTPVWANFAQIRQQLKKLRIEQVDGIVADFGTSQHQLREAPGFSFMNDGELDMRMSPAHQKLTAAELVNSSAERELAQLFWDYGEERFAREIARAIVHARPLYTARALAQVVAQAVRGSSSERIGSVHPATRVFQALRIVVNREFENIRALLLAAPDIIRPGGRLLCMTFHSLEDREVKRILREQKELWIPATKHVVTPSSEELRVNHSARSVKLRVVIRRCDGMQSVS